MNEKTTNKQQSKKAYFAKGKKKDKTHARTSSKPYSKDVKGYDNDTPNQGGYVRDNDPSWYTAYPGIYSATANINFNHPVGVPFALGTANDQAFKVEDTPFNVPSVMSVGLELTPGVTTSASSIINTAMFQNYNFVRHANSGSKNYDAVDLQMYYLAVDEALALLWQGIRAYGTLNSFSALNRAIPSCLFTAYGFDYDSWRSNPAQIRARLNLAATKMASLCVPATSRLTARHQSLFQNIFMDGESIKSQMYVFRLATVHQWGRVSQVGTLTPVLLNETLSTSMTVDQYFDILDGVLKPLLEDEDVNIMSGDVLKAYGTTGLLSMPFVPEVYITPIVTSKDAPYIMSQIENMRWNNDFVGTAITQSADGHIIYEPKISVPKANISSWSVSRIASVADFLNSRASEVTNDDVIELTRLHPVFSSRVTDEGIEVAVRSCGTELPIEVRIITYNNGTPTVVNLSSFAHANAQTALPADFFNFDWAPLMYSAPIVTVGEITSVKVNAIIGDVANCTVIDKINVDLIHDTAVASELLIDYNVSAYK